MGHTMAAIGYGLVMSWENVRCLFRGALVVQRGAPSGGPDAGRRKLCGNVISFFSDVLPQTCTDSYTSSTSPRMRHGDYCRIDKITKNL